MLKNVYYTGLDIIGCFKCLWKVWNQMSRKGGELPSITKYEFWRKSLSFMLEAKHASDFDFWFFWSLGLRVFTVFPLCQIMKCTAPLWLFCISTQNAGDWGVRWYHVTQSQNLLLFKERRLYWNITALILLKKK